MMGVMKVGPVATERVVPRRAGTGGFQVPEAAVAAMPAAGTIMMPTLLALQEAGQDAVRDRDARRHGAAMLTLLAELQAALLGGAAAGTLDRLASMLRGMPAAADPQLAAVQRALSVRAAVELARARAAASL